MEPRIQYAQTSDGVSIAYWTLGHGPPLVWMPSVPGTHLEMEWQIPEIRRGYDWVARFNTLIRYDPRGFGLSNRDVSDFSADALVRDLEAVADHLRLGKLGLLAISFSGPVAIAYAARHPERVSRLALWLASARISGMYEQFVDLTKLAEKDWEMASEAWARTIVGWPEGNFPRQLAALMREAADPHTLMSYMRQVQEFDASNLLSQLTVPTLVAHRRQFPYAAVGLARGLAAAIPDARLVLLEGSSFLVGRDGMAAIEAFLSEGEEAKTAPEALSADIVQTILFTDVEGSTALTDRLGDAKARGVLREHERLGDGFMTSFSSATKALECAIAMQRAFAEWNKGVGAPHAAPEPIRVRIGLNAGEPIAEDDDLFGTAVNEAARITSAAEGGEILVADVVRQLTKGKDFLFADRGETSLKGFEDPVRLFEVRWSEAD
jgi:class 3 adenylate cyclase